MRIHDRVGARSARAHHKRFGEQVLHGLNLRIFARRANRDVPVGTADKVDFHRIETGIGAAEQRFESKPAADETDDRAVFRHRVVKFIDQLQPTRAGIILRHHDRIARKEFRHMLGDDARPHIVVTAGTEPDQKPDLAPGKINGLRVRDLCHETAGAKRQAGHDSCRKQPIIPHDKPPLMFLITDAPILIADILQEPFGRNFPAQLVLLRHFINPSADRRELKSLIADVTIERDLIP